MAAVENFLVLKWVNNQEMSRNLSIFMPSAGLTARTPFLWQSTEGLTLPNLTVETLVESRILAMTKDYFEECEINEKADRGGLPVLPILVSLGSLINHKRTLGKYAKGKIVVPRKRGGAN